MKCWTMWGCFGYCHPNILAACKQINEEATTILYSVENTIGCVLSETPSARLHTLKIPSLHGRYPHLSYPEFPDFLHRIKKLKIEIQLYNPRNFYVLRSRLDYLSRGLRDEHCLESIDVHVLLFEPLRLGQNLDVLRLLAQLRNIPHVKIHGDVSENFVSLLEEKMKWTS